MLREEGIIVALEGTHASVACARSGCAGCHAEASCGANSGPLGRKTVEIRARNPLQAAVGERVIVEITEGRLLRNSFMMYGLPTIALVVVGALGHSVAQSWGVGDSESVGALAGLVAMALSFYGLYLYHQHAQDNPGQQPVITRIIEQAPPQDEACSSSVDATAS